MKAYNEKGEVIVETYFIKKDIIKGNYKPTELDAQKKKADILIKAIDDKYTIMVQNKDIEIKGRGVKKYDNGTYAVTESMMNKLKQSYNVMCDF